MIFERTLLHLIGQLCHGAAVGGGDLGVRTLIFAQCGVGEGVGMCVGLNVGLAVVCLLDKAFCCMRVERGKHADITTSPNIFKGLRPKPLGQGAR